MALRGNLKDFSLPDVFQLVTFSRKTGVLRIAREDGTQGSVWFREGEVFFASSDWHSDLLGERMVKDQRITPQALSRALEMRSKEGESGRRLGQILVDEGYITDKVLESFVSDQIQDTIFDLMRWDEGDFDFEAMPDVVDEDIGLSVSIENVVMEGSRRLEEWNRIRKKIPSMDVIFKMATAPGEGTFEISLKPAEWQLLQLVDGTRSVAELALETERTDFEVARVIYGLFSAGLLEFATDEEIERSRAQRAERDAKRKAAKAKAKAAEEAARKAAQEREAALAEASAKRRAEEAAAAAPVPVHLEEASEVPEFLGGASLAPTAGDQAVLDEFMGAILDVPATGAVAPAEAPAPAAKSYVPAEEPAFMSAEHDEEAELPVIPGMQFEELLPELAESAPAPAPHVPAPVAHVEPVEVPGFLDLAEPSEETTAGEYIGIELAPEIHDIVRSLGEEQAAEAEAEVALAAAAEPAVTPEAPRDFQSDLMAMGLGELPEAVPAAPVVPAVPVVPEVAVEPAVQPMGAVAESWIDESAAGAAAVELDLDALVAGIEQPATIPDSEPAPEGVITTDHDFSELMESLDVDAGESVAATTAPEASGFDTDLLLDEEPVASGGGVISTDAFLEDIGGEDYEFTAGMGDELSALTGMERRGPSRPQATVTALPEPGSGAIHRDTRVDKSTLLKIIDGVQKL